MKKRFIFNRHKANSKDYTIKEQGTVRRAQAAMEVLIIIGVLVIGVIIFGTFYFGNIGERSRGASGAPGDMDSSDLESAYNKALDYDGVEQVSMSGGSSHTSSGGNGDGGDSTCNNNGICDLGENQENCPSDCSVVGGGYVCGNGICEGDEAQTCPQDCTSVFITRWDTTKTYNNNSPSDTIVLPLSSSGTYDFIVDWNDGITSEVTAYNDPDKTHQYSAPGIYTLRITGTINGFSFNEGCYGYQGYCDSVKLLEISQWGPVKLANDGYQFFLAINMDITATDTLDLTGTTNLSGLFSQCNSLIFNSSINSWNVSNVTNMSQMFSSAFLFNQDISYWDVSSVTDMSGMFNGVESFNQDISGWDVSSVTDMSGMFSGAESFNQDISYWDVSNVTDMSLMFSGTHAFNQSLNDWNVSNVTDMSGMFSYTLTFNQPIGSWDTSNVTDMSEMFFGTRAFNQPIGSWDTSNVTDMSLMFAGAGSFDSAIGDWNTSSVRSMEGVFWNATVFNQPIGSWDVSHVPGMGNMFYGAERFNQTLNNWDVSSVIDMSQMFLYALSFNQPLDSWDVSNVESMMGMFAHTPFDQDISSWDVSNIFGGPGGGMSGMFDDSALSTANYDSLLNAWANLPLPNDVQFSAGTTKYSSAGSTARQSIIDNYNWTITDGGLQK